MVAVARVRRASPAAALALAAASFASPQELPPGAIEGPIHLHVVRARSVALERLRASGCQMIFGEFEDLKGRRLDDVLAAWKITAQDRLRELVFRDGSRTPTCKEEGVFAYTSPFSRTVFVCPTFAKISRRDPRAAACILIHEELHSLGAGEAPMPGLPSGREITARVELGCGR